MQTKGWLVDPKLFQNLQGYAAHKKPAPVELLEDGRFTHLVAIDFFGAFVAKNQAATSKIHSGS